LNPDTACSRRRQGAVGGCSCAVLLVCVCVAATSGSGSWSTVSATPKKPSFAEPRRYPTAKTAEASAIGDVNGDGKRDLVIASLDRNAVGRVSVLLNRGAGSFRTARVYRTGFGTRSVAIGDLNGDGKPDVATANLEGRTISVLLNRGDGRFLAPVEYRTGVEPWDIAIGDLNGDGRADLATAITNRDFGRSVSRVSVYINEGDGSFQQRIDYPPGRNPQGIAIADLNGDASLDLVTANVSDTVSVFMNRGDGSFRPRVDHRAGSGPRAIAIGDLNGDRRPDLVTANTNTAIAAGGGEVDSVSVLLNRGGGGFRPKIDYGKTKDPELARYAFSSIAVGDLNGDGKPDVVIGTDGSTASVFLNRGNGHLKPRIAYRAGKPTDASGSVEVGHLNGDRKPDIVVARLSSVAVLFNRTSA
jgi:FG-GAP-like repeat/FG-GAP repeat